MVGRGAVNTDGLPLPFQFIGCTLVFGQVKAEQETSRGR